MVGEFLGSFVARPGAIYLDAGRVDVGMDREVVAVRSKEENTVTSFPRNDLSVEAVERRRPGFFIAPVAMFVLAFYFSALFLHEAFTEGWELLLLIPLFLSPFLFRQLVRGFQVLGYYFAVSIVFSLTMGSWKENPYGSGVVLFFLLGLLPYISAKIMTYLWEETRFTLSAGSATYSFTCTKRQAQRLLVHLNQPR